MVECSLPKADVEGSNPFARSLVRGPVSPKPESPWVASSLDSGCPCESAAPPIKVRGPVDLRLAIAWRLFPQSAILADLTPSTCLAIIAAGDCRARLPASFGETRPRGPVSPKLESLDSASHSPCATLEPRLPLPEKRTLAHGLRYARYSPGLSPAFGPFSAMYSRYLSKYSSVRTR